MWLSHEHTKLGLVRPPRFSPNVSLFDYTHTHTHAHTHTQTNITNNNVSHRARCWKPPATVWVRPKENEKSMLRNRTLKTGRDSEGRETTRVPRSSLPRCGISTVLWKQPLRSCMWRRPRRRRGRRRDGDSRRNKEAFYDLFYSTLACSLTQRMK